MTKEEKEFIQNMGRDLEKDKTFIKRRDKYEKKVLKRILKSLHIRGIDL